MRKAHILYINTCLIITVFSSSGMQTPSTSSEQSDEQEREIRKYVRKTSAEHKKESPEIIKRSHAIIEAKKQKEADKQEKEINAYVDENAKKQLATLNRRSS